MRLLPLSDLHLEDGIIPIQGDLNADVVTLAGDIGVDTIGVDWARAQFDVPVIYTPGNHEWDDPVHNRMDLIDRLRDAASGSNVIILDNESVEIGGVKFIGATLWTNFNLHGPVYQSAFLSGVDVQQVANHHFTGIEIFKRNQQSVRYIQEELLKPTECRATVIVTHYAPSIRSIRGDLKALPMSAHWASRLDGLVETSGARLWHHGHTHDAVRYFIGRTEVLCKPRGEKKDTGIPYPGALATVEI